MCINWKNRLLVTCGYFLHTRGFGEYGERRGPGYGDRMSGEGPYNRRPPPEGESDPFYSSFSDPPPPSRNYPISRDYNHGAGEPC